MLVKHMIRWDDMMNRERKERNRKIVIENRRNEGNGFQELCDRQGGINESRNEYDECKEWLIAVIMKHVLFEFMMHMKRKMSEIFKIIKHMN